MMHRLSAAALISVAAQATQTDLCGKLTAVDEVLAQVPEGRLEGKVVLVTGGDSGLGYAIATGMALNGATVAIAGHSATKTASAAANITQACKAKGSKGSVAGYTVDFASLESTRALAKNINADYQSLSYLFNNAGIAPGLATGGANISTTKDGFESVFQINTLGPVLLTQKLLPLMRKTGGTRIVNTASTAHQMTCSGVGAPADCLSDPNFKYLVGDASVLPPVGLTYGVSKFGNIVQARALAELEKPEQVRSNSVCPGYALTDILPPGADPKQMCETVLVQLKMDQVPCPYTASQGAAVHMTTALLATDNGAWYTRYTNCSDSRKVVDQGFNWDNAVPLYKKWLQLVDADEEIMV